MAPLFDERERAAENIYVHDEELRFLALRRGIEVLADWAADGMGMTAQDKAVYVRDTVDAFVGGTPEATLTAQIQTHLERAGKPALSTNVGTVLSQAVAEATQSYRGQRERPPAPQTDPRAEWARRHAKGHQAWGWSL